MEAVMPAGRPTKYKPEFCDVVIECGRAGMGKAEMAAELQIAYSNFDIWQHEHPEFQEAVKEAVRQSQAWWERQGRIATFGAVPGFNATSYTLELDADSIGSAGCPKRSCSETRFAFASCTS